MNALIIWFVWIVPTCGEWSRSVAAIPNAKCPVCWITPPVPAMWLTLGTPEISPRHGVMLLMGVPLFWKNRLKKVF